MDFKEDLDIDIACNTLDIIHKIEELLEKKKLASKEAYYVWHQTLIKLCSFFIYNTWESNKSRDLDEIMDEFFEDIDDFTKSGIEEIKNNPLQ